MYDCMTVFELITYVLLIFRFAVNYPYSVPFLEFSVVGHWNVLSMFRRNFIRSSSVASLTFRRNVLKPPVLSIRDALVLLSRKEHFHLNLGGLHLFITRHIITLQFSPEEGGGILLENVGDTAKIQKIKLRSALSNVFKTVKRLSEIEWEILAPSSDICTENPFIDPLMKLQFHWIFTPWVL